MTYDHESKSSYSVTVKADDNNGGTATIDVTITVADVNEPPEFDSATATREVPENTEAGETSGSGNGHRPHPATPRPTLWRALDSFDILTQRRYKQSRVPTTTRASPDSVTVKADDINGRHCPSP